VFTSLTKEALPVIRYRTRDLTALLPGTARTMRRMARITGRSDDMLIIRGVNVFPTQIEELVTKQARLAPHYVLEVRREGRLDTLDVIVEARSDLSAPLGEAERAAEAKALEHSIKSYIGVTSRVKVVEPGKVERSQGKAKRVIDLRPKG
jgi:phenylacetate-CoA ligase